MTLKIKISFAIKLLRLIFIISNITYFIGFVWYIYCDIMREAEFAIIENDIYNQVAVEDIEIDSF